jgi:hypothetical protein
MAIERREFLKTTGKAITVGAATLALGGKILGANDRVRVAICGVRGRGNDHIHGFARVPGTELAALCDVDESILNQRLGDIEKMGLPKPKSYVDIRKLLEDKDIDAISIATPNHWHSLMAIWACQAGKDIYVEKPCSHNTFEGRQLVRAVKKYNRICQHGSQRDLLQVAAIDWPRRRGTRSRRCALRPVDRPRAAQALYAQSLSLQLALDLGHRQR